MSNTELANALEDFKRATANLDRVWSGSEFKGTEIADYPRCLPSFDEFAFDVASMEVSDATIEQQTYSLEWNDATERWEWRDDDGRVRAIETARGAWSDFESIAEAVDLALAHHRVTITA